MCMARTHVNLDSIEAEAAELMETDPAQAERFFGNRAVAGHGSWLPELGFPPGGLASDLEQHRVSDRCQPHGHLIDPENTAES
jgi:hypothetical protein